MRQRYVTFGCACARSLVLCNVQVLHINERALTRRPQASGRAMLRYLRARARAKCHVQFNVRLDRRHISHVSSLCLCNFGAGPRPWPISRSRAPSCSVHRSTRHAGLMGRPHLFLFLRRAKKHFTTFTQLIISRARARLFIARNAHTHKNYAGN